MQQTRLVTTLAVFSLIQMPASPVHGQTPAVNPADVASPEAIVQAAYGVIARAPGAKFQWDRFRTLFLEDARLIPNVEQTGGTLTVLTPKGFIDWVEGMTVIGGENDRGFVEEEVARREERYGDIAHVFSTYQAHFWNETQVLASGINSFQLLYNAGRWWIVGIIWDEPTGAGPIPEKYLRNP